MSVSILLQQHPHFFVLWYWIDVSPAIVNILVSKEIVDGNYMIFLLCSWNHNNILLDCWNFINVNVNGRGLLLKSSLKTKDIHMVSHSHSLDKRPRLFSDWESVDYGIIQRKYELFITCPLHFSLKKKPFSYFGECFKLVIWKILKRKWQR